MRPTRVRYGPERGQRADLWRPRTAVSPPPVVVLMHGGFWRTRYTKVLMTGLARAIASRGWAAWNIEYARIGWGGRGGWPATFTDVAAAIDHLADLDGLDLGRVVVCGHSAGGTLALWAAARPGLPAGAPGAAPRVRASGAICLAGVTDLADAAGRGGPGGPVCGLLGGMPDVVPERYQMTSPVDRLPIGVPQLVVHGIHDSVISVAMSERYAKHAADAGDDVTLACLPGVDHRSLITGRGPARGLVLDHLGGWFGGS